MGNKAENKKVKKTKRRRSLDDGALLSLGESTEGTNKSECDDRSPTIANNEEDTPPARATTRKSKKARRNKNNDSHTPDEHHNEVNQEDGVELESKDFPIKGKVVGKSKKARRNKNKDSHTPDEPHNEVNEEDGTEPGSEQCLIKGKGKSKKARMNKNKDIHTPDKDGMEPESEHFPRKRKGKSKKAHKINKGSDEPIQNSKSALEVRVVAQQDVYQISSGDEDCSKGMKKWIKKYHEDRPGLKVLQQRIDDFITAHEEQEEQAKKEREARIAEEGWTVVVHRKGGKKTTDLDSGVAVGSVAEAAVRDKLANKKTNDVGLDFYRFQRREAKRDEIMQLQSKFEEDRKRIQQLRAARKFKPY